MRALMRSGIKRGGGSSLDTGGAVLFGGTVGGGGAESVRGGAVMRASGASESTRGSRRTPPRGCTDSCTPPLRGARPEGRRDSFDFGIERQVSRGIPRRAAFRARTDRVT